MKICEGNALLKMYTNDVNSVYNILYKPVPSKIMANYEKCVMPNFLSKTLLNTNRK